jgi:maltose alpha-D-glucosyltransferase/alpha-amylase
MGGVAPKHASVAGRVAVTPDQDDLAGRVGAALAAEGPGLAGWMADQRWYGDKGRLVVSLGIGGVAPLGGRPPAFWAAIDVAFDDGSARYALPLKLEPAGSAAWPLAALPEGVVVDATSDGGVAAGLLDLLAAGARLPCGAGTLVFEPFAGLAAVVNRARSGPVAAGGLEQSNTALRYGTALLLKLFRKLQPGVNPDEEIGRYLAAAGFGAVPEPLGTIRYVDPAGTESLAGFGQAFVPDAADGWRWLLDRLRPLARGAVPHAGDATAAVTDLGRTTAALHVALASGAADPAFAPEPASSAEIDALRAAAEAHLGETLAALRERQDGLAAADRNRVDAVLGEVPALRQTLAGFAAEAGLPRIRVHGDYHLGQTLRAADGSWTIIDFEGEPARPLAERRRKTSPLKDVAGMLRSFGYARGALEREAAAVADDAALAAWERDARAAFLTAYRMEIASAATPLVPVDDAAFQRALAAWEIDKALYEVRYELANRPDWLPIPLATLVPGER